MQLDPNNGYSRRKLNLPVVANELQDTFYSNGIKRNVVHVRLNSTGLLLQKRTVPAGNFSKNHQVKISDIIGGRCVRLQRSARFNSTTGCVCTPNAEENDTSQAEDAYLYVFAYILKKNLRNCIRRERTIITLRFRSFDSHEDNLREAEIWYKTLKMHRNNYLMQDNPVSFANFPIRRLLILLNPKSGTGNAKELFREQVVPVLNEAEVLYDMYITKDSKYAFEFIQSRDLSAWSGIAAVGGDGLFHEILNGLLKRSDWKKVVENVSIGIVPCGSGNGLARSIAYCFNTNLQENTNFFPFVIHLKNGHKTSVEGCKSRILGIIQDGQAARSFLDNRF
uniref:sphingosine kinase n=1 Tax=Stomoxys calcitrans TaxID=35570 RepID=A0A1I8P1H0_STOCA